MKIKYLVLIIIMLALFITPLIIYPSAEFSGTDSTIEELISNQGYEPWFNPIWEPPSSEIESLLFTVQASIGAIVIGYFIGFEKGKRVKK
ncbi:MAG: energy-coupling factor ABC transporter substrate-binding protein [Nitrososphaerales archaeon]